MGRILAIDFGLKRTGIAVTDNLKMIANPLETVASENLISFLKSYCEKEKVETFVIGAPKRMNNQSSDIEQNILLFIDHLKKVFPKVKIERQDERFTSKLAFNAMITGGLKKKDRQNKETIDKLSATIILQSFLGKTTL